MAATQVVLYQVGGTVASQIVTYTVTAPFTKAIQLVQYDVLGHKVASQPVTYDVGTTGERASVSITYDVINETPGSVVVGLNVDGQFLPGIRVHSKAGAYLGTIGAIAGRVNVGPHPKSLSDWQGIQAAQATLTLPRIVQSAGGTLSTNPDLTLLAEDRIIVIGNSHGLSPWAGSVETLEWTDGALLVTAQDLYGQLSTPIVRDDLTHKEAIVTRTGNSAASLAQIVMGRANAWLGREGEALWEVDASGSATFFGDDTLSGDTLSILAKVLQQSFAEMTYDVRCTSGAVIPILVWRDAFSAGSGADLASGATGNVRANPSYSTTVSGLINAVRITGSVTTIESLIPAGATALPIQEIIPVAEVWNPAAPYRRRTNLSLSAPITINVTVGYTLPAETQQQLADQAEKAQRELYKTFIHAIHDQYGRPWHDGWAWSGGQIHGAGVTDTDDLERVIHLRDYVHWLHLAKGPAAIVMKHRTKASYVRVTFDRVNAVQQVARFSQPGDIDPATVFDFEWRRYLAGDWDPRRDGIGTKQTVRTVIAGSVRTVDQWRVTPYYSGGDWTALLIHGITAAATNLPVDSVFGAPPTPFIATLGYDEVISVLSISENILTVLRAQAGTVASIHEQGEPITYTAPSTSTSDTTTPPGDQITPDPIEVPWPDGVLYAQQLLARMGRKRLLAVHLVDVDGDWATVAIGSSHTINVQTEGPSGGVTGTARVVGYDPSEDDKTMELLVEVTA